jgi:hypothetical protein
MDGNRSTGPAKEMRSAWTLVLEESISLEFGTFDSRRFGERVFDEADEAI